MADGAAVFGAGFFLYTSAIRVIAAHWHPMMPPLPGEDSLEHPQLETA